MDELNARCDKWADRLTKYAAAERTRIADELERLCDVSFWKDDRLDLSALTQYRKDMDIFIEHLRGNDNDGTK